MQKNMVDNLEGSNLDAITNVDLSVLDDAEKYNINLDSLEIVDKAKEKQKKVSSEVKILGNLDISLSEIIDIIISSSERPTFIVRDDNLVYINSAAMQHLDINIEKEVIGTKFFNLVAQEDWNTLAENIGEMLTNSKELRIRLKSATGKIRPMTFRAIYLSEIDHFSFVLIGEHIKKSTKPSFNNLYDDITGLPNFFLFEDRVQVAISLENAKEDARDQNMIAVISVNIDNIETFRKMHIEDTVVKKVANNLVLNLPKNATVALGLKYHFWIMLPGLRNRMDVNREIRHIYELLNEGVSDNFTRHELLFSIGASSFPNPGHSTKKVIEQAISAVKKAQTNPKSSVEFFVNDL